MAIVNRRMKVMHIISGDLWAGAEVQAYTLLKQIHSECELQIVLMNPGELADRLAELDIAVVIIDESRQGAGSTLLALRKVMLSFKPDIIHTHRQKENILGSVANLLSVRAACVRTSHGAPESVATGLRRIQVKVDRLVGCYLQQAVIAVSADLAEQLASVFPAHKIHIINNGVDVGSLHSLASDTDFRLAAPDAMHIGIIGRLEPVKRVDIFLSMAAFLKEQYASMPFRFHVIGDGKLKEHLVALATSLGLSAVVTFHGHRKDMAACIHSLNAIVMCSDHEGTPMTALEAMALGTPLIAHKVGGLKDILKDYPALQVEEHVPQAYAEQVIAALTNHNKAALQLPEHYQAARNAAATLALYQTLVG